MVPETTAINLTTAAANAIISTAKSTTLLVIRK